MVFEENSPIPCKKTIQLENSYDLQSVFPMKIVQNGKEISNFEITKLPRKRKGELNLNLTFHIMTDGFLHVYYEITKPSIQKIIHVVMIQPLIHNPIDKKMDRTKKYLEDLFHMSYHHSK